MDKNVQTSIENVNNLISDLKEESKDLTLRIEGNLFQIKESESFLKSVSDQDDQDSHIFFPRKVDNRFENQMKDSREIIERLNSENMELYRRRNSLEGKIILLQQVLSTLENI